MNKLLLVIFLFFLLYRCNNTEINNENKDINSKKYDKTTTNEKDDFNKIFTSVEVKSIIYEFLKYKTELKEEDLIEIQFDKCHVNDSTILIAFVAKDIY